MKGLLLGWGLIFLSALFDSLAAFVVKQRFNQVGGPDLSSLGALWSYGWLFVSSPVVVAGLIVFFLAPAVWFFALSRIDLSVGYPLLVGFHLIFVFVLGVLCLGETLTARKAASVVLVLASIILLYGNERGGKTVQRSTLNVQPSTGEGK